MNTKKKVFAAFLLTSVASLMGCSSPDCSKQYTDHPYISSDSHFPWNPTGNIDPRLKKYREHCCGLYGSPRPDGK